MAGVASSYATEVTIPTPYPYLAFNSEATEVTATVSAFIPTIPLFVLVPQARAVPAAAESVTGEFVEYVIANDATGNCIIRILS